jgi:hypothetical protein
MHCFQFCFNFASKLNLRRYTAVFKLAIFIQITEATFGLMLVMRNIFLVRLIVIFFPMKDDQRSKLIAMRDMLDQITVEKFDITLNLKPFPITTKGGTEIPPGLKIDIVNFNFFDWIIVRRLFLHVQFWPPLIEFHLFVDPFQVTIGGAVLLKVEGVGREAKLAAKAKMAEADKLRADALAIARAKNEAGMDMDGGDDMAGSYPTVCGNRECHTCARTMENTGFVDMQCGSSGNVITSVAFVAWGVAAEQGPWPFSTSPGLWWGHCTTTTTCRGAHYSYFKVCMTTILMYCATM